ncbi:outer membrane receptor protein involved in Fe transport [Catalinimonas alkaloidigena]|uniref:TonB-dependent receptor domain-containing protein n=1 Tax=Catalinimonas alkaloidigena TaxID=1075417 RepID=UPI002407678B|nr:TonB-dependent receptor [Catalinimonas alkaloidigena]MDF9798052.1 outer membrane receptor protein involved in Fe transport [Catalinimonas alkaloidigena]
MKNIANLLILFTGLIAISGLASAQTPQTVAGGKAQSNLPQGDGKISGIILDKESQSPIPYATVALIKPDLDQPIDGTIADEKGKFQLKNIAAGIYKLSISFIGYEAIEISSVEISGNEKQVELGDLFLTSETKQLDEVVVLGQRDLIEEKVDRTVYNAEHDQTTKGGDATDVLKRVPMLSVDLDGNVYLRGSQNIKVLIDNKPSTITATNVGDALKQIPADQIKSVEVITSPSARYDAEGTGGIINIVTKKNKLQGGTLSVDSSVGNRGSNLGLNGSYRKGKVGLSLGGFGRTGYNILGSFENNQLTTDSDGNEILTTQQADTRNNMLFGRYTLGLDYDINEKNWVSASVQLGAFNFYSRQDALLTQTFQNDALLSSSLRDVNMTNLSENMDVSLTYVHSYEKPQQEFILMGLYSRNNRTNDFVNDIINQNDESAIDRFKNENQSFNQEITLQADYQMPIGDKQMLEFGGKEIMRTVSSDYQFYISDEEGNYEAVENDDLSNVFNYDQNVMAGYVSYTLNLDKYSIKPGLRYEYTTIQANFQDEQEVEIPSYGILVPSVNLSRKLENGDMVKAAYNRRIQRPSLQFLNPNLQASNPLNITQGNPDLEPEYTNNYELSYSTFLKGTSLNISTFMRNTSGSIQPIRSLIGQDTVLTTYENIGSEDAYGMSVFANVNISNKFSLNGGTDLYYAVLDNNVNNPLYQAENEGWVLSGRLFGNYNINDSWGLQFFGFYRGKQVQLQGYQTGFGIYSLSIKKDFNDKKGSIGFGAENFFTNEFKMITEVNSPIISQSSTNSMRNMGFKINFSYRIGKLNADPKSKRRKSIQNNDLKEGGSNQMNITQ